MIAAKGLGSYAHGPVGDLGLIKLCAALLGRPADVADTARLLVARRRESLRGVEPQAQARRLVGLLARRGYPPGLAYQIVRESLACPEIADAADIED